MFSDLCFLDRDYPVDDTSIACCSEDAFALGEGIPSSPLASGRGHCFSAENGDLAAGSELPSSSEQGTGFAVSVIHGMLFGLALTGSRSLVFTSDRGSLLYSARLHGLSLSQECTVVECQYALLAHMLTGQCYDRRSVQVTHTSRHMEDVSTCINVSSGFSSSDSLSRTLLEYVLSYSERTAHLTMSKLKIITASLGLNSKLSSYPS